MRKILLFIFVFACASFAHAQFYITTDYGSMSTTYGTPGGSSTAYSQSEGQSQYVDLNEGLSLGGKSERTHGFSFTAGVEERVPFDYHGVTVTSSSVVTTGVEVGNPFEFGGYGMGNWRHHNLSFGAGFAVHDVFSTNDVSGTYSGFMRPHVLLYGLPVSAKYNFAHAKRAFVQGYGEYYVDSDSLSISNNIVDSIPGNFQMDYSQPSYEVRGSTGYMFNHIGIRANYSHREVYIKADTGAPVGFYSFKQDFISGGFIFSF